MIVEDVSVDEVPVGDAVSRVTARLDGDVFVAPLSVDEERVTEDALIGRGLHRARIAAQPEGAQVAGHPELVRVERLGLEVQVVGVDDVLRGDGASGLVLEALLVRGGRERAGILGRTSKTRDASLRTVPASEEEPETILHHIAANRGHGGPVQVVVFRDAALLVEGRLAVPLLVVVDHACGSGELVAAGLRDRVEDAPLETAVARADARGENLDLLDGILDVQRRSATKVGVGDLRAVEQDDGVERRGSADRWRAVRARGDVRRVECDGLDTAILQRELFDCRIQTEVLAVGRCLHPRLSADDLDLFDEVLASQHLDVERDGLAQREGEGEVHRLLAGGGDDDAIGPDGQQTEEELTGLVGPGLALAEQGGGLDRDEGASDWLPVFVDDGPVDAARGLRLAEGQRGDQEQQDEDGDSSHGHNTPARKRALPLVGPRTLLLVLAGGRPATESASWRARRLALPSLAD